MAHECNVTPSRPRCAVVAASPRSKVVDEDCDTEEENNDVAGSKSCVVDIFIGQSIEIDHDESNAEIEQNKAAQTEAYIAVVLFYAFYCTRTPHLVIFIEELSTVIWIEGLQV